MRKKWYGWIPNASGAMSFKTAGRRSNTDMQVTVFSDKIPYHSIDPKQHKHLSQLVNRDTGNPEDQTATNKEDDNKGFVLSFVCQERDNFDGVSPLFPYIYLLVSISWLFPLYLISIHIHQFILSSFLLSWAFPVLFISCLVLFSRKWYKKLETPIIIYIFGAKEKYFIRKFLILLFILVTTFHRRIKRARNHAKVLSQFRGQCFL